jgi:EmrB/QacA subfamily drug resistance transporter
VLGLSAEPARDAVPVALAGKDLLANVLNKRFVQTDHGVRRDPGRDLVGTSLRLLRDERGESVGVAGVDLLLAREEGGALGDQAVDRAQALPSLRILGGEQATRLGNEAREGRQDRLVRVALANRVEEPLLEELHAAEEEVLLCREVVEDGLPRDLGFAGDLIDGDGVEAVLLEQAPRSLGDRLPCPLLLPLAKSCLAVHLLLATLSKCLYSVYHGKWIAMNNSRPAFGPPAPKPSIAVPFAAIVLAMLPAVLDQTILATALPTIASDLGRLSDVSWVVTAYVVAAAALTPLWGKLGDRHGRKLLLEIALVMFVSASALCGAAQDISQLIALRAVQGAAAGGLMALAMAVVGDLVSPRERGRYQGYIAAAFAAATVIGPLLGGLLVDHASWRWVFYANLPVGVAALAGLRLRLQAAESERPEQPLDASGAALIAGATSAFMLTCVWGGDRYAWGSAQILALIAATMFLVGALVLRERRAADPIVPLNMLRTPTVAVASAALFLAIATMFAVTVFVPLLLQTTTGASPTQAGLLLIPMMLGITLSTTLSGRRIARTGRYKRFPIAGLALMTIALVLLAAVAGERSRAATGLGLAIFGLGFGMVTQVLIVAVQNSVERRELGVATAATGFFRALGGGVGAAVLGAVFAAGAGTHVSAGVQALGAGAQADIVGAVQTVFLVAAPLAALALIVVLRLPELPLEARGDAPAHPEGARSPTPAPRVPAGAR